MDEIFDAAWRRFGEASRLTSGFHRDEFPREPAYAFLIPLAGRGLSRLGRWLEAELEHDYVAPLPDAWLHTTLLWPLAGIDRDALVKAGASVASTHEPFEAPMGPVGSFTGAAFIEARAPQLCAIGDALRAALELPEREDDCVPHVTVALYARSVPAAAAQRALAPFRERHADPVLIDRFQLVRVRRPVLWFEWSLEEEFVLGG